MNFSKNAILLAGILLTAFGSLRAQVRQTREEYIDRYKSIAVAHMERYGIPASITMAQGILESDCGNSRLSIMSNNHFGIKCKRNWTGEKVYHDDDAKGECFRSYPTVEASYQDHAEFLDTQPRYDSLFAYSPTDYKSWARGLKAAGYATAPDYAQRLCRIIEEAQLFLLDQPDGERLYASRSGRKITDPEGWFTDQTSMERPADASSAATLAASSACSHTMTGWPFVATMECLSCAVSSASVGLRSSMAQVGHAVAHVPHPMQRSGSTSSSPARYASAPDVHASTQRRQSALRLRTEMQRSSCTAMASLSISPSRASRPLIRDMTYPLSGISSSTGSGVACACFFGSNGNVMACSGHTSAHARHLLQSLSVVSPAATSCRLMPSGHACSHRLQALPRPSRRHFSASIWGRNVRFSPLNSESSAPRGQKR